MATSPDRPRLAGNEHRPLTADVVDALREAVIVVDIRSTHLPLILANAAARRLIVDDGSMDLGDLSLFALLANQASTVVDFARGAVGVDHPSVTRQLTWRFPRGSVEMSTELNVLQLGSDQPLVMLTFREPAAGALDLTALPSVIEQMPFDLLILDRELTITYANTGAARTAATTAGELLSLSALVVAPTSAVPRQALIAALQGEPYEVEAIAVTSPGAPTRWFKVALHPLKDQASVVGVAVLSVDVTAQRLHDTATLTSHQPLAALTDYAHDIIAVVDRDGKVLYVSGGLTNSLGYTPAERLAQSIFDLMHPQDLTAVQANFADLVAGATSSVSRQIRVKHKDGSHRWLEWSCAAALDNPLIGGLVVNARDITERTQAEKHLAQRDEAFRLAADAVDGSVFEWDLTLGVVHWSRGVHELIGVEPQALRVEGSWTARIHADDRDAYVAHVMGSLKGDQGWTANYRIRDTAGRYRSVVERGLVQRNAVGEPIRAVGCAVDVSEIQRLTDLLAEVQRVAQLGGWEYLYDSRYLGWTDETYRIFQTTPQDFELTWGSMLSRCLPESRHRLVEAVSAAEAGDGNVDLELEILTLEQNPLWVRLVGRIEFLDGRPFRACGSLQDIQASKLAQLALQNSTQWLRLSLTMADMQAWRWNRAADSFELANHGDAARVPIRLPGMRKFLTRVHPKDRLAVRRAIDHAFERHTQVQREFRLKSSDGRYRAYAAIARPVFDASERPSGLVGVTQDITARHESQARLRCSEQVLRVTTANSADTLMLVDTQLLVRFINRPTQGRSIDAIVGQPIANLIPEAERDRLIPKLRGVLTSGRTATFEFTEQCEGETVYVESRAVLVNDAGIGTGLSITARNVTERKRLEQEILAVAIRERQAIGRDLHDGLGQELTGVALMLRGLATRLETEAPAARDQVDEIVALVNQSIQTARSLARGLFPVNTDGGGLEEALRSLADRTRDVFGLAVELQVRIASARPLNAVTINHLYRIAQEALTNTARHAKASSVTLCILVNAPKFMLRIIDDGVGMGLDENVSIESGMGLKIMRYRANMIGATLEIAPHQPHGTVVSVTGQQTPIKSSLESAHAL